MIKKYIVVFNKNTNIQDIQQLISKYNIIVDEDYTSLTRFYLMSFDENDLATIKNEPIVLAINDYDAPIALSTTQNTLLQSDFSGDNWGLSRIDQTSALVISAIPLPGEFTYFRTGSNTDVYVCDTGINPDHTDFTGRFEILYDYYHADNDPLYGIDDQGHGSHVSSTIAGTKYGVAKGAKIYVGKSFDVNGGLVIGVIGALNAFLAHHNNKLSNNIDRASVVNLSLGFTGDQNSVGAIAINDCIEAGMIIVAAAGNDSLNLNLPENSVLPAELLRAITVGASNIFDTMSSFSNYGTVIDIFAPGESIAAAGFIGSNSESIQSGTSMAAPHVAGVLAQFLDTVGIGATESYVALIASWLISNSIPNVLTLSQDAINAATPNRMLYLPTFAPVEGNNDNTGQVISITYPYEGTLTDISWKADHTFISTNRSIVGIQQSSSLNNNRDLFFLMVVDYADLASNNNYQITTFNATLFNDAAGIRIFKLSETRIMVVRDKDLFIYEISSTGRITLLLREPNFFIKGMSEATNSNVQVNALFFYAEYISDDTVLFIESTNTSTSPTVSGLHSLFKLNYDVISNTVTKTEIVNLSLLPGYANVYKSFSANIQPIPGSNNYYLTFSGKTSTAETTFALRICGIIGADLTWQEQITIPTQAGFTPRLSGALREDKFVFHEGVFGLESVILSDNNVVTLPTVFDTTGSLAANNPASTTLHNILVLDSNHYFVFYDDGRYVVYQTSSGSVIQAKNANTVGGALRYKTPFQQISSEIIIYFNLTTLVAPTSTFNFSKLIQGDV